MRYVLEHAKFGDRFRTESDKMVIFLQKYSHPAGTVYDYYMFAIEEDDWVAPYHSIYHVNLDGENISRKDGLGFKDHNFDIVSKWSEKSK